MRRGKVLVVDDSRTALMFTCMVLARGPFEVITASGGEEGIAKALSERPDVILLDVVMPRVSGFDVCRRLRDEPATRHTPIIMLTTRGEQEHVEAGYTAGCTEYLTKPVDGTELNARIMDLISIRGGDTK
jgi:two-component system alkaline phosphatase synthesis response regulator PhoP